MRKRGESHMSVADFLALRDTGFAGPQGEEIRVGLEQPHAEEIRVGLEQPHAEEAAQRPSRSTRPPYAIALMRKRGR